MRHTEHDQRVTFRAVLANREFRALYLAQTLSVTGDQLARIAVGVMIFDRTGSSALTGVSYAVSYLPWLIGGPTLSVLADRHSRRSVMIACDVGRCALTVLLALASSSAWMAVSLVGFAALLQPPFTAARAALIPEIVGGSDAYAAAATLTNATLQVAVLAGFGAGGAITAVLGPSVAVLLDSLTFAVSAVVILQCTTDRAVALVDAGSWWADIQAGWSAVFGDAYLTWLVATSWILVGTVIATEAIAVPYAHAHGEGATAVGLLTASMPMGTAVGAILLGRGHDSARSRAAMSYLAPLTPALLAITALNPQPTIVAIDWFGAGAASAFTVQANRIFVASVPRAVRGRAFGVAAAGISGAQGLGTLAVGMLASRTSPAMAVGIVCLVALLLISATNARRLGANRAVLAQSNPESHATVSATPSCDLPAS